MNVTQVIELEQTYVVYLECVPKNTCGMLGQFEALLSQSQVDGTSLYCKYPL